MDFCLYLFQCLNLGIKSSGKSPVVVRRVCDVVFDSTDELSLCGCGYNK